MSDEELFEKVSTYLGSGVLGAAVFGLIRFGKAIWHMSAREQQINASIDAVTQRMNDLADQHRKQFEKLNARFDEQAEAFHRRLDEHGETIAYLRGKLDVE